MRPLLLPFGVLIALALTATHTASSPLPDPTPATPVPNPLIPLAPTPLGLAKRAPPVTTVTLSTYTPKTVIYTASTTVTRTHTRSDDEIWIHRERMERIQIGRAVQGGVMGFFGIVALWAWLFVLVIAVRMITNKYLWKDLFSRYAWSAAYFSARYGLPPAPPFTPGSAPVTTTGVEKDKNDRKSIKFVSTFYPGLFEGPPPYTPRPTGTPPSYDVETSATNLVPDYDVAPSAPRRSSSSARAIAGAAVAVAASALAPRATASPIPAQYENTATMPWTFYITAPGYASNFAPTSTDFQTYTHGHMTTVTSLWSGRASALAMQAQRQSELNTLTACATVFVYVPVILSFVWCCLRCRAKRRRALREPREVVVAGQVDQRVEEREVRPEREHEYRPSEYVDHVKPPLYSRD